MFNIFIYCDFNVAHWFGIAKEEGAELNQIQERCIKLLLYNHTDVYMDAYII